MRCLTIANPYPYLILSPADELHEDDEVKRIENRPWGTNHRGPLLIHSGKSTTWLRPGDRERYPHMLFGYVLGMVDVVACIQVKWKTAEDAYDALPMQFKWCAFHPHASGQGYWWVLDNVKRFVEPVLARGKQGLFDLPGDWENRPCKNH